MPELPEVETIRRELEKVLPGQTVRRVEVRLPKIAHSSEKNLNQALVGKKVLRADRRAKVLLLAFSGDWNIVIHLKMSGQIIWQPTKGRLRVGGHPIPGGLDNLPNAYSHVIFHLSQGTLYFNDQRQFGYIKLLRGKALAGWLESQHYGPEPLRRTFTFTQFNTILDRHQKKKIKPTLLDQTVIAGVGNIYADESCFFAHILPTRRIASLTPAERQQLYRGIRHVMELSLKHKGTSADSYRTTNGDKGRMMPFLKVYGREGKPCKRCGGEVQKIVLAGRGTHFCPNCQR